MLLVTLASLLVSPLAHYVADGGLVPAPFTTAANDVNLSGQTFVPGPEGHRYFWIQNAPEGDEPHTLWETDASFQPLRSVELRGDFGDTEDLALLARTADGVELGIVTEAGELLTVVVADAVAAVRRGDVTRQVFSTAPMGNKGPEGVAYDPATRTFYACKEKSPMAIVSFTAADGDGDARPLFDAPAKLGDTIDDISACAFDPRTGRLLVLSHESHKIVDVALDGTVMGELVLPEDDVQYEGLALNDRFDLVLSSEPNLVRTYRYQAP